MNINRKLKHSLLHQKADSKGQPQNGLVAPHYCGLVVF